MSQDFDSPEHLNPAWAWPHDATHVLCHSRSDQRPLFYKMRDSQLVYSHGCGEPWRESYSSTLEEVKQKELVNHATVYIIARPVAKAPACWYLMDQLPAPNSHVEVCKANGDTFFSAFDGQVYHGCGDKGSTYESLMKYGCLGWAEEHGVGWRYVKPSGSPAAPAAPPKPISSPNGMELAQGYRASDGKPQVPVDLSYFNPPPIPAKLPNDGLLTLAPQTRIGVLRN